MIIIKLFVIQMYKLAILNYAAKRMLKDPRRMSLPMPERNESPRSISIEYPVSDTNKSDDREE